MKIVKDSNDSLKHHSTTSSSKHSSQSPSDHTSCNQSPLSYPKTSSKSKSRPRHRKRKHKKSSKSNSYSGDRQHSYRSHSQHSVTKSSRYNERSRSLNIFGLHYKTKTHQLIDVFNKYGSINDIDVVVDKAGKSRGFGFVDFKSYEASEEALKQCSDMEIDGRKILVEFSSLQRSPTPIPGISVDDLDITSSWRREYDERYHKDRNKHYSKHKSFTNNNKSRKDRSHTRSWPLHWA